MRKIDFLIQALSLVLSLYAIINLFSLVPTSSLAQERPTLVQTSTPEPTITLEPPADETRSEREDGPRSSIEGIVTDLSTGQPGRGVAVQLNEIEVLTDSHGHYSLTGLPAGEMLVRLIIVDPNVVVTEPILVTLDGQNQFTLDLQFYSQLPPTPSPFPMVTPAPPTFLPVTGGD